jgi:hypothetical protein
MSITIFSQDQQKKEEEDQEKTVDNTSDDTANNTLIKENSLENFNKDTTTSAEKASDSLLPTEGIKKTISLENELEKTPESEIKTNINKANSLSHTIKKERSTRRSLVSFAPKPARAHFDAQMKDETIILMLRQHPITQLGKVLIAFIGLFFPILLFASPFLDFLQPNYKAAVVIGWYLVLSGFALEIFLSWYFHVFFITDRRVIDVDFHSMVHKDVTSAKLENIQDVSYVTAGVLASLINYGTVYLQTAGTQAKVEFEKVPQPAKVAKIINELIVQKKRKMRRGRY